MSRELGTVNIVKRGLKTVSPIPVTGADFCAAVTAGELSPGRYYHLTDKDIYLLALEADEYAEQGFFYDSAIDEIHTVWYNCADDYIWRRIDNRGNDYTATKFYTGGADYISEFKWGDDNVYGNKIVDSRVRMIYGEGAEYTGTFADNTIMGGSTLFIEELLQSASNSISRNVWLSSSIVGNTSPLSVETVIEDCHVHESAIILNNNFGFEVSSCDLHSGSVLTIGGVFSNKNVQGSISRSSIKSNSRVTIESANTNTVDITDVTLSSESILLWRSTLAGGQPNATVDNLEVRTGGFANVFNARRVFNVSINDSTLFIDRCSSSTGLNNSNLSGGSIVTINNFDATGGQITELTVSQRSSVTFTNDTGSRTLARWNVDKAAVVTSTNIATNASDVRIEGWVVELFIVAGNSTNGFVSHNNLTLKQNIGRHNRVTLGSSLPLFHFFNTKVVGTAINITPNSPDEYCGLFFLYGNGISQNPAAPSVIDRFNNAGSIPNNLIVTIENGELPNLPNISYLKIQKSARQNNGYPGQSGRFFMPADTVLEGTMGIFGNGGDSITFYKQFQGEMMQLDTITIR